jgi:hypothetical protein
MLGGEEIRSKEYAMIRPSTAAVATLGIDIGKNVFHLIGPTSAAQSLCARGYRAANLRHG